MKKIIAAVAVLLATTTIAKADNYSDPNMLEGMDFSKFYAGANIGYIDMDMRASYEQADNSLPMLDAYVGYEFDYKPEDKVRYALELGGYISKNTDRQQIDNQEYAVYMDVVGRYQLPHNFTALGTAGLQYSKISVQSASIDVDENEVAPRIGAGIEYKVNDKVNVRGMARYVFSDYRDTATHSMQYTVGMNYKF